MLRLLNMTGGCNTSIRRSAWCLALALMLGACPGMLHADATGKPPGEGGLLIFISLSMPAPSLQRIAQEAGRTDAVLVLRGLRNGRFHDTLERLHELYGMDGDATANAPETRPRPSVLIDPLAFDRFRLRRCRYSYCCWNLPRAAWTCRARHRVTCAWLAM